MFPTDLKSWLIFVLITILLGALGSGFWETIFKPVFSSIGRFLLKIFTLGMKSAIDSIYKDIAKRFVHKPIIFILMMITFAFSGLLGSAIHDFESKSLGGYEKTKLEISNKIKENGVSYLDSEIKKLESEMAFAILLMATLAFILSSYSFVRNAYIISAILYFDQCLAICMPYLDEEKKIKLLSQYALINTGNDYFQVVNQLKEIAEKKEIKLPKFVAL